MYVVKNSEDMAEFERFKKRFPLAKSIQTYDDAVRKSFTKAFWIVWSDLEIEKSFNFEYEISIWDEEYIHVFKNSNSFDGVCLVPKKSKVSVREFDRRFFVSRKEIDILASTNKPYDIVFISYNEPNSEDNWNKLISKYPQAKRIHGIKGIHQAHIEAAKIVSTSMFWVVDGDSIILDDFSFNSNAFALDYGRDAVYVWRSQNPINNLVYGYGGVKLLPTQLTLTMDTSSADMTTSISPKFKLISQISNTTAFNTDPFNTWKSAFRECVKLSSKIIYGQDDKETEERLDIWCSYANGEFSDEALSGAHAGRSYGQQNAGNLPALSLINDFDWLFNYYQQTR